MYGDNMRKFWWWATAGLMVALLLGAAWAAEQGGSGKQRSQITSGQGEPEGGPNAQLATLQAIDAMDDQGGIRLKIRISRAVRPTVTTLNDPDRLVFDFAGTDSTMSPQRFTVNRNGLKAIRAGVQPGEPRKTRVVLDLAQRLSYEEALKAGNVIVKLGLTDTLSVATVSRSNPPADARNQTTPANVAPAALEEISAWAVSTAAPHRAVPPLMVNSVWIQEATDH